MRIIRRKLKEISPSYPFDSDIPLSKTLFIDIETTGFTARSAVLYLIGCTYFEEDEWQTIQWFATTYEDEKDVVESFFQFAIGNYTHLVHFNGNNFDLPFIQQKCEQYQLPYDFSGFQGIDIYKRIVPFKSFLRLPNCKQKTLEQFLDIYRNDPFDGGELISVYHDFVKNRTDFAYETILNHNLDDLAGMLRILPILSYADIFSEKTKVKKVQANYYRDYAGNKHQELYMKLSLPLALPKEISYSVNGCYFTGKDNQAVIRVPLYEKELKYFYSNYKDYYYLPNEDVAIHKSIASFVDKEHRIQAKASNCYTRKQSSYLPQWDILFEPFFKSDYKSDDLYFEITDSMKKDRSLFQTYALHVLKMMTET